MARLKVAECRRFFKAVSEKASEMGVPVAMAVVNAEGHLLALERMDEAGFITPEIAWSKAFTVAAFRSLHALFFNKWYFDELYDAVFVQPALAIGRFFWKKGDGATIDGLGPDGIAARSLDLAGVLSRFQSGYLYQYAFVMLLGVAAVVTYFVLQVR